MKRFYLLKCFLIACVAMLIGGGSANAQTTVTFDFTTEGYGQTAITETSDYNPDPTKCTTNENVSLDFTGKTRWWKSTNGKTDMRIYTNSTMTFSVPDGNAITKITMEITKGKTDLSANKGTYSEKEWTGSENVVIFSASAQVRMNSITVTYQSSGTPGKETPTFTYGDKKSYSIYSGDSFNAPALDSNTDGTVTYESSNMEVATISDKGVVSLVKGGTGTTTITASAAETERYNAATASYTLEVKTVPQTYASLSTLRTQIKTDNVTSQGDAKEYKVNLTNAVVSYVNGSTAYLEEGEAGVLLYGVSDLAAGDKFTGTATVKGYMFSGSVELTSIDGVTKTTGGVIPCTTATIAEILASMDKYESRCVKVERANVTIGTDNKNSTVTQGESNIAVYSKASDVTLTKGTTVDMICYPGIYTKGGESTKQLNVWSQDDITEGGSFTIGADGYATYYNENAYTMPEGVDGGIVTARNGNTLTIEYNYKAGTTVPAKTALLLKGAANTYAFDYTTGGVAPATNLLHGGSGMMNVAGTAVKYYILSCNKEGKNIGFYFAAANGAAVENKAPHAYLAVDFGANAKDAPNMLSLNGEVTGIDNAVVENAEVANETIYTISGVRVNAKSNNLPKGLYIVNGKKIVVK